MSRYIRFGMALLKATLKSCHQLTAHLIAADFKRSRVNSNWDGTCSAHPRFPQDPWSVADVRAADAEGWNLFESDGYLEIQCKDESSAYRTPQFLTDEDALTYVKVRAGTTSDLHHRALHSHRKYQHASRNNEPAEHDRTCTKTPNGPVRRGRFSLIRASPVCPHCGSDNVGADAAARWNFETQSWEVYNIFDKGHGCDNCEATHFYLEWRRSNRIQVTPTWLMTMNATQQYHPESIRVQR